MLNPELNILLAEDDKDARYLIQRIISRSLPTAAVNEIGDGRAALRQFEESGADLLIVDQRLPMLPGIELIREVRARDAAVPIILISSTPSTESEAFGTGINHFVDKANLLRDLPPILSALLLKAV
jgi:CheY-like chemotaxis protein